MPEQKNYTRALVTSATALTSEAVKYAKENSIQCFTDDDVVDWIFDSFGQLQMKPQQVLGMTLPPRVI